MGEFRGNEGRQITEAPLSPGQEPEIGAIIGGMGHREKPRERNVTLFRFGMMADANLEGL